MGKPRHGRADPSRREGGLTSGSKARLLLVLRLNLTALLSLGALSLILPLSGNERWIVLLAVAVLAGVNWAALDLLGRR